MGQSVRILLLADTHIGFDLPAQPRVERRRRGHDFLANYERALAPARDGKVDAVVHGGDVFHRSRIAASLAWQGLNPLVRVADLGIPVYIVPGNHERSRLPHFRLVRHPRIRVFDQPRTFVEKIRGMRIALSGFPFWRGNIRARFRDVLEATEWDNAQADVRLLCMHHCVEGATVGPADFTFTSGADVIRVRELPAEFAAVLSGHIHRRQTLTRDLAGKPLAVPVLYPGSIERTSIAEREEAKGYMIVKVAQTGQPHIEYRHLPARPMLVRKLHHAGSNPCELEAKIHGLIAAAPTDAVLRIQVSGEITGDAKRILSAGYLRSIAPATMNVDVRSSDGFYRKPRSRPVRTASPTSELPFPTNDR